VPAGLRGKAGNDAAGAFPSPSAAVRRRTEKNKVTDTLELLDEELWKVDETEPTAAPPPGTRRFSN